MSNRPLISIIDDDQAVREPNKGMMRAMGYLAETIGSAEDFLKFDRMRNTACLIADVQMPQMSGLDLHRRLLASGVFIPTILMTAYPDDGVRARALKAGVLCYLTKPFTKEDLLSCIDSALDRGEAGRRRNDNSA
ncbi:MAG: response regulator receiver protein [Rhodospirillales bacterium]|nr:response regulator receiver protein [Rhodospirillales bacterium]